MKFKKITAILLSAAALAAIPSVPVLRSILPDTSITAEAADTYVRQFTVSSVNYKVYRDKEGTEYAVVTGAGSSVKRLKLSATVTYDSKTYPIRKIGANAFSGKTNIIEMNFSDVTELQEIGENAFKDSSLQYVELGGSGTYLTIKKSAFENTQRLNYVYAYSGIDHLLIEKRAFWNSTIGTFTCSAKTLSLKSESFAGAGHAGGSAQLHFTVYSGTDSVTISEKAFMSSGIVALSVNSKSITIGNYAFIDSNERRAYSAVSRVIFGENTQTINLRAYSLSGQPYLQKVDFQNPNATLNMNKYTFSSSAIKTINLPNTVKTIPEGCFNGCKNLTCNPITENVTTIRTKAFASAKLPNTVKIGKKTTVIADDAFVFTTGIKKFEVDAANTKFKSTGGVLLSKDGTRLLCYPQLKTSTSYTTSASTIPNGAFNENEHLKTLSIKNLVRPEGETVAFYSLNNLESLSVPAADYNGDLEALLKKYEALIHPTKVHTLNSKEIVTVPGNAKPYFNDKFSAYMNDHFEDYEDYGFMKWYVDKAAEYVVNSVTDSTMSDMQKAVRLHDWIMNNVEYDPLVSEADAMKKNGITPPDSMYTKKNHVDASVFLHQRNGHYYTVCDGYARCYRILMNKAGVKTYYVIGRDENPDTDKRINHAWNLVLINGCYYHVDVTWDDGRSGLERFKYFMQIDSIFNGDGHKKYNWEVQSVGTMYDPYEEICNLNKTNGVTGYSLDYLGRIGSTPSVDQSAVNRLEAIVAGTRTPSAYEKVMGDINFDGVITQADVTLMKQYINEHSSMSFINWCYTRMAQA